SRLTLQIGELVCGEANVLQVIERSFEPRRHQVAAPRWQAAHEELKRGAGIEAGFDVSRRHGQLVEIRQQPGVPRIAVHGLLTRGALCHPARRRCQQGIHSQLLPRTDRKSTRLNSSHGSISYAVFCLKKKKNKHKKEYTQTHK